MIAIAEGSMYIVSVWIPYDSDDAPVLGTRIIDAANGQVISKHGTINIYEGAIKDFLFPYFEAAAQLFKMMADSIDLHGQVA